MKGAYYGFDKKTVNLIFDLDGTLLNTMGDIAEAVNYSLRSGGLKERSIGEIKRFLGTGINNLLLKAVYGDYYPDNLAYGTALTDIPGDTVELFENLDFKPEYMDELLVSFRKYYGENINVTH